MSQFRRLFLRLAIVSRVIEEKIMEDVVVKNGMGSMR
jgi:hypothetical protein